MTKLELIKNAKTELKKCYDFLKEHENALTDSHNLKLHDAFFYDYSNNFPLCAENERERGESYLFYSFCESEYDLFKEDLRECFNIDFEKSIKYIGHTSSFYLWDKYENNTLDLLNTLLNEYFYNGASVYLKDDLKRIEFDTDFFTSADVISHLNDIVNGDFYKYIVDETSDTITIYETLKGFKDNQVENFKEFLQWHELDLQEERDAENARIMTDRNNAENIARFYNIPHATMIELKECIYAYA